MEYYNNVVNLFEWGLLLSFPLAVVVVVISVLILFRDVVEYYANKEEMEEVIRMRRKRAVNFRDNAGNYSEGVVKFTAPIARQLFFIAVCLFLFYIFANGTLMILEGPFANVMGFFTNVPVHTDEYIKNSPNSWEATSVRTILIGSYGLIMAIVIMAFAIFMYQIIKIMSAAGDAAVDALGGGDNQQITVIRPEKRLGGGSGRRALSSKYRGLLSGSEDD